jgi:arylsulfatase A-like enzyme
VHLDEHLNNHFRSLLSGLASAPGSTNGLRGRKRDLTEGGIREPGLIDWPGVIRRNVRTLYPAATFDILSAPSRGG